MTANIAQFVALASYGNAFLKTGQLPEGFFPDGSMFRYCHQVIFEDALPDEPLRRLADTPPQWFEYLLQTDCRELRLHYQPARPHPLAASHQLAAFVGGGGTWQLEAVYAGGADVWVSRWEADRRTAEDRRIWAVDYGRIERNRPVQTQPADLDASRFALEAVLTEIADFARKQNETYWADVFDNALQILHPPTSEEALPMQDILAPGHHSIPARQLLLAAGAAWVFGGMGSWNDLGFSDPVAQKRYDELSARLFAAINQAVLAGGNASG